MPATPELRGGVYAITDASCTHLISTCEAILGAGATLLQYRDTSTDHARRRAQAGALLALCRQHGVSLIICEDIAMAAELGADGVHLGQQGNAVAQAREQLGARAIIGVACGNDIGRARDMAAAGADYLSFGAFFTSPTIPSAPRAELDLLRQARSLGLPLVAIGGVRADNGAALIASGADYLAAVSALFGASDPAAATRAMRELFPGNQA